MTGSRFAVIVLSLIPLATGAAPAPVTDLGGNVSSPSTSITPTPPSSTSTSSVGSTATSRNQGTEFQLELMKQVQQLQTEVSELRGQLEVQNYQIQQLTDRQRDLYQELDRRVAAGGAAATGGAVAAAGDSGAAAALPTPPADGKEQESYEKAVQLVLQDKNYDKAIPAFQKFIKDYPNSSYQPNARYWLGQLLLNKGDSAAAKGQFQKVVTAYKDSPKVPEALLKLGIIAQLDGDTAAAKANYEKVISQYPQSATAQQAKTRLQSL